MRFDEVITAALENATPSERILIEQTVNEPESPMADSAEVGRIILEISKRTKKMSSVAHLI